MKDTTERPARTRLEDIDRAKGLAILLVVIGHIVAREPPAGNDWYVHLKTLIYQFHMPFFVYLSGFVMFYTGAHRLDAWAGYWDFLRRRALRLLVPFVIFGLAILAGKMLAASVLVIDNKPSSLWQGLRALVWDTSASPATSIWYLYVIFAYCVIVPPLMWLARQNLALPLALAAVLLFAPLPEWFYLDRAGRFLVFFLLGGLAAQNLTVYDGLLDRWVVPSLLLFLAALLFLPEDFPPTLRFGIIGTLALPALHGLVRSLGGTISSALLYLGGFSLVIYLFNTIMIGLAKGVFLRVMPWDGWNFLLFAPALLAAGLFGPVLLKTVVLRRFKPLDVITT